MVAIAIDVNTGKPRYINYSVALPPRSLDEFILWVYRYMDKAQIITPKKLVEKHKQAAQALVKKYM